MPAPLNIKHISNNAQFPGTLYHSRSKLKYHHQPPSNICWFSYVPIIVFQWNNKICEHPWMYKMAITPWGGGVGWQVKFFGRFLGDLGKGAKYKKKD